MRRALALLPFVLLLPAHLLAGPDRPPGGGAATPAALAELLERHCLPCHQGPAAPSGFDLAGLLAREAATGDEAARWRRALVRVRRGEMPPPGTPPLAPDERAALLAALEAAAALEGAASAPASTARPTLRRLGAEEYARAVRDLLGVTVDAASRLPADDVGHGFDVIGDVLALPPPLMEKYWALAEEIARLAVPDRDGDAPALRRPPPATLQVEGGGRLDGRGVWVLYSTAEVRHVFDLPRDGRYRLRARAWAQQAGPEKARLALRVDGRVVATRDVEAGAPPGEEHAVETTLEGGPRRIGVAFVNDYYRPDAPDPADRDRNLVVVDLAVEGPLDRVVRPPGAPVAFPPVPEGESASRHLVRQVARLARRAWRHPVDAEELRPLLAAVERGLPDDATPEAKMRLAVVALLTSPRFLFRLEADPPGATGPSRALTDHELATRLATFLWSSVPDERLLDRADAGRLRDDDVLRAEIDRMLADARAGALSERFATQWLQIRDLPPPDPRRFPGIDAALLEAMREETVRFFDAVLREDRDVRTLLDADFAFVNEDLARLYGLPGVTGPHLRRVPLPPGAPGGVLVQASVLRATSNPTRTSPVKRGKWVLEALLDAPPPPPPPGVGTLEEVEGVAEDATLRERLARHREDPSCAVCHARMDPLGLALENYDAVGRWRVTDADGRPIDAQATLPDGRALQGVADLQRLLAADPAFDRSLARHLLVYALGRGLGPADDAALDRLAATLERDPTLRALIHAIVRLDAFRQIPLSPAQEAPR